MGMGMGIGIGILEYRLDSKVQACIRECLGLLEVSHKALTRERIEVALERIEVTMDLLHKLKCEVESC